MKRKFLQQTTEIKKVSIPTLKKKAWIDYSMIFVFTTHKITCQVVQWNKNDFEVLWKSLTTHHHHQHYRACNTL